MNPSNSTVFRFIATYGKGFDELVQRLILGYGYMNDGGLSHQDLVWLYLGSKRDYTNKLYAGYFTVENGLLRIFSGGSQTLLIPRSQERDKRLMEDLSRQKKMNEAIVSLFPPITAGTISHVMLAP
jgi:hypothetical protein